MIPWSLSSICPHMAIRVRIILLINWTYLLITVLVIKKNILGKWEISGWSGWVKKIKFITSHKQHQITPKISYNIKNNDLLLNF